MVYNEADTNRSPDSAGNTSGHGMKGLASMQPHDSASTTEQSNTDDALPKKKSYIDASDPEWAERKARQNKEWAERQAKIARQRAEMRAKFQSMIDKARSDPRAYRGTKEKRERKQEIKVERLQFAPRPRVRKIPPSPYPKPQPATRKYRTSAEQKRRKARFVILERDQFTCAYCGRSPLDDGRVKLHVDHIIPKAKGGTDTADNLVTSCATCNLSKSDHLLPTKLLRKVINTVRQRNKDAKLHSRERLAF